MTKFILESKPKILENINYPKIEEIEEKLMYNLPLNQDELNTFLDYLIYITRIKIDDDFENASYKNKCNTAQCMIHYYLEKLNITHYLNRSFNCITEGISDHSFVSALFNIEGELIPYIIDPTYRQFFEEDRCMKTPLTPGNFILEDDKETIVTFLKNGYMIMSEENTAIYGNSLYFTKASLPKPPIPMNGKTYIKVFLKDSAPITKTKEELINQNLYIEPLNNSENIVTKGKTK